MTWTAISDTFLDDPQMLGLDRSARLLILEARVWSNRHGTDGAIPKTMLPRITDAKAVARLTAALVAAGVWEETNEGWRDVLFEQSGQVPATEVERRRAAGAERQRRWRERHSRDASVTPFRNASRDGATNGVSNGAPSHPRPSRPKREGRGAGAARCPHGRPQAVTRDDGAPVCADCEQEAAS